MTHPFAVIVLAAGRSERMGTAKPLLTLGEYTFLQHILLHPILQEHASQIVTVIGHYQDELLPFIPAGVTVAKNENYDQGRTGSVQCGLRALGTDIQGAMIWPVDCPIIPSGVLEALLQAWEGREHICIPSFKMKRGHPPIIGAAFFDEILQMPLDHPLRNLYANHEKEIQHIVTNTPLILHNVNTQEDYYHLKQLYEEQQRNPS